MKRWNQRRSSPADRVFAVLVAVLLVTLSAASQSPQRTGRIEVIQGHDAAAGEVLVKFRADAGGDEVTGVARELDVDRHRPVGGAGVRLFHSRRFSAADLVARLSGRPDVVYAEPNYLVRVVQAPSDPQFPQLWGLRNTGQAVNGGLAGTPGADIRAVQAWSVSTGSRSIVVGVVDTGVDYTHPDLVPNIWSAPARFQVTLGGVTITCEAGTHGFNAITGTCDPMDDHNHGTHVSGTIGAVGNNDVGVVGVSWTTAIMAAKFIGPDGSGNTSDAIDAIDFLIQAKAAFAETAGADVRVLSNSWGDTAFSQALLDEVNRANDAGMLFVAAAGNSGLPNDWFPMYPASFDAPNVVSVAATDNNDRRAYFSNYGATTVHLGAPGVNILSTTIGNTYSFFDGTTMATPHVSGAAALVLSVCALDTAGLKADLLNTVDQVPGLATSTITGGRLNVDTAIRACTVLPAVPAGLVASAGNGQVSLTWLPAPGATLYSVKRSTTAGGPYATVGTTRTTSFLDTNLTNDTAYYYVVSASNPMGESGDSTEVMATPIVPADLIVSALTVPSPAGAGDVVSITDTVTNQGQGRSLVSTTRFYLSLNMTLDVTDTLLAGARTVAAIAPGAADTGSSPVTLPSGLPPGGYYIIAKADGDAVVFETSETNNTRARAISIGPDLSVSAVTVPASVAPGSTILVTDTVRNQGGGAAGPSTTRFYLSSNGTFDAGDKLLGGSRQVLALAAGASSAGTTLVTIPAELAVGTSYLIAKADADNAVPEKSETNNTKARSFQSGADLTVSALTVPYDIGSGATIVAIDTIKNQGSVAAGPSTTRFYLSTDLSVDEGDTLLDGGRSVGALGVGVTSSGSTSLVIPSGLATRTYYVIAKADADGTVTESAESNNTRARAVAVGPDLVVSAVQAPGSVVRGAAILVTNTVLNDGGGVAETCVVRFYLSRNAGWDSADLLLGENRVAPALASGGTSVDATSVTIPASLAAGTYYIIAKVDADNVVVETSENNNTKARLLTVAQ